MSPTARATAKSRDWNAGLCSATLTRTMKSTRKRTARMMRTLKRWIPRSNSLSGGRARRRVAMSPNFVAAPVAVTTAVAVPLTTEVPRNTAPRSPCGPDWLAASFSAGIDSPVSAASCTCRSRAERRRASAGTRSPAERRTTSPGTTSRRASSRKDPSRKTVAVGATFSESRSAARCERYVCAKLSPTPRRTTKMMIVALATSSRQPEMTAAISRITTRGFAKSPSSCTSGCRGARGAGSFGPAASRRAAASLDVSPRSSGPARSSPAVVRASGHCAMFVRLCNACSAQARTRSRWPDSTGRAQPVHGSASHASQLRARAGRLRAADGGR